MLYYRLSLETRKVRYVDPAPANTSLPPVEGELISGRGIVVPNGDTMVERLIQADGQIVGGVSPRSGSFVWL